MSNTQFDEVDDFIPYGYVSYDDFSGRVSEEEYQEFLDRYKKTACKNDAKYDENGNFIKEMDLIRAGSAIFAGFKFE